jgi:hypothetical protein
MNQPNTNKLPQNDIGCPKGYPECMRKAADFKNIKMIHGTSLCECAAKEVNECPNAYFYGFGYLCNCPVIQSLVKAEVFQSF